VPALLLQNRAKRDASPSFCGLQNIIIDVKRGSPNGDRQNQPAAFPRYEEIEDED
jgi:hypothetical protein